MLSSRGFSVRVPRTVARPRSRFIARSWTGPACRTCPGCRLICVLALSAHVFSCRESAVLGWPHRQELPIMTRRTDFRPVSPRAAAIAALFSLLTTVALVMPVFALFQEDQEAQPLTGVFTVTIARDDVPPNLPGGPALTGLWNVTFSGDGSFSLARQDVGEVVTGNFEAAEATLTFNEWSGLVGCDIAADSGEPATYAWSQTEDRLTLTPITDSCIERLTLLTTRPLGGFEACAVSPQSLLDPFATGLAPEALA